MEATTFDLVLTYSEEVKPRHGKGAGLQLCAMVLDFAMTHFLLEHNHLAKSEHSQGRLCSRRSTHVPFLSCSWGGDEHSISETFFQMPTHMLSSKRQGSDSCLTKVTVIRSANLRQLNNLATMNDPFFHVVKGGGCWEISVLIWVRLWRTETSGFLWLFAKTVESLGHGLGPLTAFMVENVFGNQVRVGHNNL